MVLLFIVYLIGSGLGGLLAIGTCWTASRRYLQRSVALVLAQPMAVDGASVAILASHHDRDGDRTLWILKLVSKLAFRGDEHDASSLLDICGATHVALLEQVAELHPEWNLEVFDSQPAIQHLLRSQVLLPRLAQNKLVVNPGASLDHVTSAQSHYDVVLVLDNLVHSLPPHKRLGYFQAWAQLVKPNSGHLLVEIECDPLSETSEAGILQRVYHRISPAQLRLLLESSGLGQCQTSYWHNKVCITARKYVPTIEEAGEEVNASWTVQQEN